MKILSGCGGAMAPEPVLVSKHSLYKLDDISNTLKDSSTNQLWGDYTPSVAGDWNSSVYPGYKHLYSAGTPANSMLVKTDLALHSHQTIIFFDFVCIAAPSSAETIISIGEWSYCINPQITMLSSGVLSTNLILTAPVGSPNSPASTGNVAAPWGSLANSIRQSIMVVIDRPRYQFSVYRNGILLISNPTAYGNTSAWGPQRATYLAEDALFHTRSGTNTANFTVGQYSSDIVFRRMGCILCGQDQYTKLDAMAAELYRYDSPNLPMIFDGV